MGERAGEPGLTDAARAGDEDIEVFAQPAPGGEGEDEGLVESAGVTEVDVLDAGVGVAQLRAAQSIGHAPVVTHGGFAVDEQAEALLERERLAGGGLELLGQRAGHAEALELVELVDDGVIAIGSTFLRGRIMPLSRASSSSRERGRNWSTSLEYQ